MPVVQRLGAPAVTAFDVHFHSRHASGTQGPFNIQQSERRKHAVSAVVQDWAGKPTYGTAHIFFTSKVPTQLLSAIKGCPGLIARLKTLAEVRNSVSP